LPPETLHRSRRLTGVTRWSWRKRLAFLAALAVPLLVTAWWSWFTRDAYGWDYAGPPDRIFYCGRIYLPGPHATRAQIDEDPNAFGRFAFRRVGQTALGKPIFAHPLPESVRHQFSGEPLPCDMSVYVQVGADDYISYGLSGGP
jgi:hypothetical protein